MENKTPKAEVIIIMGVCGCGKSTLGEALVRELGGVYLEGDMLHPPQNIAKMSSGIPLDDNDRWPWYDRIAAEIGAQAETHSLVLAGCSALKKAYRDRLRKSFPGMKLIFLKGPADLIRRRMEKRQHFMPPSLLDSQFAALEEPSREAENCLHLDIGLPTGEQVAKAARWIRDQGADS